MIVVSVFICQSLNTKVLLIILILGFMFFHKLCSSLPSQSEFHSCHCILKGFPVLEVCFADLLWSPAWCIFWQVPFLNCDLDCRQGLNWISSFPELLALSPFSPVVEWLCRDAQVDSVGCVGVQGMPGSGSGAVVEWQGGDQSKAGLSPGALLLQDGSVGFSLSLPMALMLQF